MKRGHSSPTPSPNKRDRLIESLLARPEFVDYWSYKWSRFAAGQQRETAPPAMWSYYRWIRTQVRRMFLGIKFARSVVTASGNTLENGAANFFVLHQDPKELAETTSQAFLGMSIGCAHCHNHPLEKWTNDQYYGMANLFSRVKVKNGDGEGEWTVFSTTDGELIQPRTGRRSRRGRWMASRLPMELDGRSPGGAGRLAHLAGESLFQPGDNAIASGRIFWASGWSKRSTTCG